MAEWLQKAIGLSPEIQSKLLVSLLTILVILFLRRFILKIVFQRIEDVVVRSLEKEFGLYRFCFCRINIGTSMV